jgi:hypothetical protein
MLTSGGQNQTYFWRTKTDLLLGTKPDLLLENKNRLTSGGQNQTYFWRTKTDLLLEDKNKLTSAGPQLGFYNA